MTPHIQWDAPFKQLGPKHTNNFDCHSYQATSLATLLDTVITCDAPLLMTSQSQLTLVTA